MYDDFEDDNLDYEQSPEFQELIDAMVKQVHDHPETLISTEERDAHLDAILEQFLRDQRAV